MFVLQYKYKIEKYNLKLFFYILILTMVYISDGTLYILDRRCGPGDWKMEFQMLCYNEKCNYMKMPSVKKNEFTYFI